MFLAFHDTHLLGTVYYLLYLFHSHRLVEVKKLFEVLLKLHWILLVLVHRPYSVVYLLKVPQDEFSTRRSLFDDLVGDTDYFTQSNRFHNVSKTLDVVLESRFQELALTYDASPVAVEVLGRLEQHLLIEVVDGPQLLDGTTIPSDRILVHGRVY